MQSAETVLGVLRERGRKGLPCNELYRQMFNRDLYLLAYGRIYANQGAMTPGASAETADGMSEDKIDQIIEAMRYERYRFSPARRIYIPKKNGKLRPLGLPSWSDKLVGEVVRLLLEAYYEPTFSDYSHGFRPGRGCHTALREVENTWAGTTWFIEGDISDCFGSLNHEIMVRILSEKIHDNRFLRLIKQMLKAGYLEDWKYHETLSGAPQGGVVSPILSNIYLHKLDVYVETVLIPQYTRGKRRKRNPEYGRRQQEEAMDTGLLDSIEDRMVGTRAREPGQSPGPAPQPAPTPLGRPTRPRVPSAAVLPGTPTIIFWGSSDRRPKPRPSKISWHGSCATTSRSNSTRSKTLVTHARTRAARYLGYEIIVQHRDDKLTNGRRSANGVIALRVPLDRDQGQMCPLPAPRQTLAPAQAAEPGRLRHRPDLRGRIPGHHRLLPARHRRLAPGQTALARPDVDAEDPRREVPVHGVEDGRQVPGEDRDTARDCERASRPGSTATASRTW